MLKNAAAPLWGEVAGEVEVEDEVGGVGDVGVDFADLVILVRADVDTVLDTAFQILGNFEFL